MAEGAFVYKDGVETYMEHGQVVIDKLVEVDGKIYYVDGKGHKVKDTWAVIDNDGHYGYFGNFGDLVVNKIRTIDGHDYYFDENGILYQDRTEKKIKVIDGIEYIANKNGELKLATEETFASDMQNKDKKPEETTTAKPNTQTITQPTTVSAAAQAAAQQAAAQQAAQRAAIQQSIAASQAAAQAAAAQVSTQAPFANAINVSGNTVPNEFGGPGVAGNNTQTNNNAVVIPAAGTTNTNTQTATEIKIKSTTKITDTVEGDDYDCNITLIKPIMIGTTEEETLNLNSSIEELMDVWMEDVQSVVGEYSTLPKSVTFTSASITSQSKSRLVITLTGNVRPKSGSSKIIKYKITYDRNEANGDISKTSSN